MSRFLANWLFLFSSGRDFWQSIVGEYKMKYSRDTAVPCPYYVLVLLLPAIDRIFCNNTSIGLSGLLDDKFVVCLE
ncbi:hypothetical protein QUA79_03505 [Microcoleus sp. F8-D1]